MLRPLCEWRGWYLDDRSDLVETVEGADAWLFCQGILSIGTAAALRCQHWICSGFVDAKPVGRQQCGHIATLTPDGEALCVSDAQDAWWCDRCGVQFPTKYGGIRGFYSLYCHPCAAEELRCEECGASCPEQMARVQSEFDPLLCVTCQPTEAKGP
jgi:hypothetical protein